MPARRHRGVTLIELMVGLTILAFLLLSGAPSLSDWIRNTQIRAAAESMLTGLQHARAEAVRRNTPVRFQLTTTLANDCALSTAGKNWVVNQGADTSPEGGCGSTPSDTVPPYLLQKNVAANASAPITVAASQSAVTFNGFGSQSDTTSPDLKVKAMTIDFSPTGGTCLKDNGSTRCLRIEVSAAGQARMCDRSLAGPTTVQPMACVTP
jgi:type IV fimbrial biogenesis protein FimT